MQELAVARSSRRQSMSGTVPNAPSLAADGR
jgi:hypothetical protein